MHMPCDWRAAAMPHPSLPTPSLLLVAGHYVPNLAFKLLQHSRPSGAEIDSNAKDGAGADGNASRALRLDFRGFLLGAPCLCPTALHGQLAQSCSLDSCWATLAVSNNGSCSAQNTTPLHPHSPAPHGHPHTIPHHSLA